MKRDINWTILIIITISSFTFATGYLLNVYTDKTENLRSVIASSEKEYANMEKQRITMLNFDIEMSNLAELLLAEASTNAIEYEVMNSTFTSTERDAKLKVIEKYINFVITDLNNTYTAQIQSKFEFGNIDQLAFATKAVNGYDYIITRQNWENNNPGSFITLEEFLLTVGFNNTVILDLFEYFGEDFPKTTMVLLINWQNFYLLHDKIILSMIEVIEGKRADLSNTQAITTLLSVSVSIATIGTVLSSAMASKASEKRIEESFKILHQEIVKAEEMEPFPKAKRSKIAILGLLIAFFFALYGLISAITFLLAPDAAILPFP
ncbi:MAG: hypothetical protein JSU57_05645 [Candidatus Heimdallarchaeota archaeon]|nr:MAG: hypothetical protein JSU57_05645 [Candidatus Heimdallarchaeota archaeon]